MNGMHLAAVYGCNEHQHGNRASCLRPVRRCADGAHIAIMRLQLGPPAPYFDAELVAAETNLETSRRIYSSANRNVALVLPLIGGSSEDAPDP